MHSDLVYGKFAYQFSNKIAVLSVCANLLVSTTTYVRFILFQNLGYVFFKYQPISIRCLSCVHCRSEHMVMIKFHADCNQCQGFSNVHCWHNGIYICLLQDRIATVTCQAARSLFGKFIRVCSLVHSILSSGKVFPILVTLGYLQLKKTELN